MIWRNPWAFTGLLALAVPVIIHLLGRRNARITKFPTLRFVGVSRLMATRWTRLSDIGLLSVRLGILAAAVTALAGPLLLTDDREMSRNRAIARAIVVDTSASLTRAAASGTAGETGRDVALRDAARLAGEAASSVVVQTPAPSRALRGALAWLATRPGRREVVIISDFQTGALDEADIASIPPDIGIGLVKVGLAPAVTPVETVSRQGSAEVVARITPDSLGATVEWSVRARPAADTRPGPVLLAGANERERADAAHAAALSVSTGTPAPRRPIAIVFPGYEGRAALARGAAPMSEPWMGDVLAALRRDSILVAAASGAEVADAGAESSFVAVARTAAGRPVAVAAHGAAEGADRLLLFAQVDAGSLASAALIAAAMRAASVAIPVTELEPATLTEQTIATWRREARTGPEIANGDDGSSDARWFWLLALVLLAVETWMRRTPGKRRLPEVARERAA